MWMKNEDELVEAILEGDHRSFERLLQPYRQGLLNMAYRMTGNLEEAKEICQEALIRTFRHLGTFKRGKSFKSWIYRITVNSAYDFLREKKKYHDLIKRQRNSTDRISLSPEGQYLKKEIKLKLERVLRALTPKEKIIFLLRDGNGFSIQETSAILGCSSLSIRTHLSRARRKIRDQFREYYGNKGVIE